MQIESSSIHISQIKKKKKEEKNIDGMGKSKV